MKSVLWRGFWSSLFCSQLLPLGKISEAWLCSWGQGQGELLCKGCLCYSWWELVRGETVASGLFGLPLLARTPIPWTRVMVFRAPHSSWYSAQSRASTLYKWGLGGRGEPYLPDTLAQYLVSTTGGQGWMNYGEVSPLTFGEKGLCSLSSVWSETDWVGRVGKRGKYHRFSLILTRLVDFNCFFIWCMHLQPFPEALNVP